MPAEAEQVDLKVGTSRGLRVREKPKKMCKDKAGG